MGKVKGGVESGVKAAGPWKVEWVMDADNVRRPHILDAYGAELAEVKIGYGEKVAFKIAKLFAETHKKWRG